jgi:hypothetical protein
MTYLEDALAYLDMGWSVYPAHNVDRSGSCTCGRETCSGPGKHPVGRWTEYQHRRPTEEEVRMWFSALDCNVGMVTGQVSGIAVVDVDGEEGQRSLKRLKLAPTLSARTGSGGLHLYYALRAKVSSRVRLLPGIDLRANGGFVVLPPSEHKSGRRYEWEGILTPIPFPARLLEEAKRKEPLSTDWSSDLLKGVSEGERSTTAARLAGRYFGLGLSVGEVWILMTAWNERNSPPLRLPDLKRTVQWAERKQSESAKSSTEIVSVDQILSILKGETIDA